MQYDEILYSVTDGMAVIRLNSPERLNALTSQMRAEITHAVKRAQSEARVLVLTGAGRAFCSGQDLGATPDVNDLDLERLLREEYRPMIEAISQSRIPTVAAVNGPAAGAGANLALAADVVIAAENAYFLQAFARIGLIPDAGGTGALPKNMGLAKAMGAALFGEKISAKDADAMGMIWEAVSDDSFEDTWLRRATVLANGPTEAYARMKTAIRAAFDHTDEDQFTLEAELQGECAKTRDFKEGVAAFSEKRPASFEGR